ncbi:hypothetical protein [Stenoxybacter acetivorans]|uniref:hypothetical protein n=1 Tax=Stenoxybacter acetivorans TaxID=422441 RepID=UPI0012EC328C|nr:hypothetical protein [Stenoxybacter acetivorans]
MKTAESPSIGILLSVILPQFVQAALCKNISGGSVDALAVNIVLAGAALLIVCHVPRLM